MKRSIISIYTFLLALGSPLVAQDAVITLNNPSFEDAPRAGGPGQIGIKGWFDCGSREFRGESPPDVHTENPDDMIFGVTMAASDGDTYLGIVTRENETWESVSQKLEQPLEAGKCYTFSIDLARSETYFNIMQTGLYNKKEPDPTAKKLQSKPAVLRIWGGINYCPRNQLLAESEPVTNTNWQTYTFEFTPNINTRAISLEAFYKTPVLDPYFGHVLVDNASEIKQIPCPGEEIIAAVEEKPKAKQKPPHLRRKKKEKPKKEDPVVAAAAPKAKDKILKDLNRSKIFKGQKINVDNLYFEDNQSNIKLESKEVLDEVVDFLLVNKDVRIEIGGHTNGRPKHEFCDSLSRLRAKEVAQYLNKNGVPGGQLQFKGYGKRKPIADNKTRSGRKKNQRVEIKILSVDTE